MELQSIKTITHKNLFTGVLTYVVSRVHGQAGRCNNLFITLLQSLSNHVEMTVSALQ